MAVYPIETGYVDYSSTGSNKFIPQIWSTKLLTKFYEASVFGDIANTDYEGEIKSYGDKVIIRTVPNISVNEYKKGLALSVEKPESPAVELLIDKGYYFNYVLDRVDKYQSDINLLNAWAESASESLKSKVDSEILAYIDSEVSAENKGATAGKYSQNIDLGTTGAPITLTSSNILEKIVDCGVVLDEQSIPEVGRFIILPPKAAGLLKKSDLKNASITGDSISVMRNGKIGMIDRFTVYVSNHCEKVTDGSDTPYNIIFGVKQGLTFASQITETETLKSEHTFGDLVRGLIVYGRKVVIPTALGVLYAKV